MIEIKGDVFELFESGKYDAICITTNGIIKKDGTAVMGAGVALEATKRFKGVSTILANNLQLTGNKLYWLGSSKDGGVISYPTKHHWRDKSDIELIKTSAQELMELIDEREYTKVLITPMGCGNGGLNWSYVKNEVDGILDDRVIIVSNN